MADVAYLMHWTPSTMQSMELAELQMWRNLAVERHNAVNAPPSTG